jgi:hypothetical protein
MASISAGPIDRLMEPNLPSDGRQVLDSTVR